MGSLFLLLSGELVGRGGLVSLAGLQFGGRESRLIRRIGIMLGFETEGRVLRIDLAALAGEGAVEEIAGVELNARLGGEHFHHAAGGGPFDARRESEARAFAIDHPIVVVAMAELELFVVLVGARADGGGLGEIEGRAGDGLELAGGDQAGIDRSEEHTSELQSLTNLVCRLLLEKKT